MTFDLKRRNLLALGGRLALGGGFAAAIGASRPAGAQLATVRATHFGGPYQVLRDIIGKPFEDAKLGRVVYDVETSPTAITKMQAQKGDPPFDVVMMSRSFALRALNGGMLMKISAGDFPEAKNLIKGGIAPSGSGVAMVFDMMDIMVDTKQVKAPVTSWLDLWRPEFKDKLMLPAAFNGAATFAFIGCIARAVGGDERSEAAVNEAFARLKALKPNVRGFFADGAQPMQVIERGDIAISPQFAIRIANQTRKTPNVVKVTPKEGVCAVPYDLCITEGTKNVALAKSYVNFCLTQSVQEKLVQNLLATPSRAAVPIAPDIQSLVTTDPAKMWFMDEEYGAGKQREWLDRYTREVQT